MNPSTFRSNLKTQLAALSDYTTLSAKVWAYPPGKYADTNPTIFIRDIEQVNHELFTLIGDAERNYTVTVGGYAPAAGQASTDADWQTMESNAYTLINGLIGQLESDGTVNGACNYARVSSWSLAPSQLEENGRAFMDIEATIAVRVLP